ncbi:hypothetical protein [Sunxiuqinia rutila]|uniref:hypothetical protein n=1 Tax=Sunxiuqinia rutila TaxID=1397841 RepID=UPI003D3600FC
MNINRSNYEIYFLDYLDGNLPDSQVDDFLDFLANNPDLNEELKAVSSIRVPVDERMFPNKKALLKKEITEESSFDYRAVAFLENDLEEDDKLAFLRELTTDPQKEQQFDLLLKTQLKPDNSIQFSNKKSLYKKPARKVVLLWGSRVAAALVLLFAVWAVWDTEFKREQTIQYTDQVTPVMEPTTSKEKEQLASRPATTPEETAAESKGQTVMPKEPVAPIQPQLARQEPVVSDRLQPKREEVPQKLTPISSRLELPDSSAPVALAGTTKQAEPLSPDYLTVDEYLAQKVLHKAKDEPLKFSDLVNAGLNVVSSVSSERLDYETNEKGKLSEISLNTRLLAFSIPLKKER